MITPIITILRWFSLIFYEVALQFFFVRGALLQLTATRVGSRETKSCKALTRICFDNTASFMNPTFLLILLNFFSPATFLLLYERNIAPREWEPRTRRQRVANLEENIWSRWHQDKRPRCPSLPGLASPRLGGGSRSAHKLLAPPIPFQIAIPDSEPRSGLGIGTFLRHRRSALMIKTLSDVHHQWIFSERLLISAGELEIGKLVQIRLCPRQSSVVSRSYGSRKSLETFANIVIIFWAGGKRSLRWLSSKSIIRVLILCQIFWAICLKKWSISR